MLYKDFSLKLLKDQFGVQNQIGKLFGNLEPIEPSEYLRYALKIAQELPVRTEKAKSEYIAVPILNELRMRNDKFFTIYSGENLLADAEKGLNGECDFILAKDVRSFDLNYPIISIVEAKRHDLELGVPQCAAQMLGAKLFNEKQGIQLEKIYGCVTTGRDWLFLQLEEHFTIDIEIYYLANIQQLLAIFNAPINTFTLISD